MASLILIYISKICKSAANQLNTLIRLKQFLSFHAKEVLINSHIICFVLEVARFLDPTLKVNAETIYLFKLIFKFAYESYLLLNLC